MKIYPVLDLLFFALNQRQDYQKIRNLRIKCLQTNDAINDDTIQHAY